MNVEFIYNTKSYRGQQVKRPRMDTNEDDPYKRWYYELRAYIETDPRTTYPIVFNPYKIAMQAYDGFSKERYSFDITNVSDETVKLNIVDFPDKLIKLRLPRVIQPGETATGEVILRPAALDKAFEKSITLELRDDAKTRFTIPIVRTLPHLFNGGVAEFITSSASD